MTRRSTFTFPAVGWVCAWAPTIPRSGTTDTVRHHTVRFQPRVCIIMTPPLPTSPHERASQERRHRDSLSCLNRYARKSFRAPHLRTLPEGEGEKTYGSNCCVVLPLA